VARRAVPSSVTFGRPGRAERRCRREDPLIRIDESADGRTIDLPVGEEIEVRLPENPTTGYRWQVDSDGKPAVTLLDDQFDPPGGTHGRAGSHGWRFEARQVGEGRIALASRRRWESGGQSGRTFAVSVRVAAGRAGSLDQANRPEVA
jgi:inhibitor of cysteine peptidase